MENRLQRLFLDLPRETYLLTLAQAVNLTCAVLSVTIAAIVGTQLATMPSLATVPYGMQFASVMLCTYPASMLMRRHGRRVIFCLGAVFLVLAGIVGYVAVAYSSFGLLVASHAVLGIYIACANFYRFAAVDNVKPSAKPGAISLVVSGGVLAAVAGPNIANFLQTVPGFVDFSLCYAAFCLLGVITLVLMRFWRPQSASADLQLLVYAPKRLRGRAMGMPILVAIFCSAGGYFMMNLLMVEASLVLKDICSFSATSFAIELHVLSMFAPSFVTASIIEWIGLQRTLATGFLLISAAIALGTLDINYEFVFGALILLGLGWNLTYVGGGALLTQSVDEYGRHFWQGINDTIIAACAALGAFMPAPMLIGLGWNGSNMALAPVCLLGIVLCCLLLPRNNSVNMRP